MSGTRPRVVVVGAGFGGLRAVRALAKAPVDVVLIDRNNYHLFQPLLYQVAVAALPPSEIAYPIRSILRGQGNASFLVAEVTGIDVDKRVVATSHGPVAFDVLILATGAVGNTFGMADIARHAFELKWLPDALRLRNHILKCFEEAVASSDSAERRALLTIVVAGGGPTGVEVAGAASELLRGVLGRDYRGLRRDEITVTLLEAGPRLLAMMPERLARAAERSLAKLEVEVRAGAAVAGYDGRRVTLRDGSTIDSRTLVWSAGVRASPLVGSLGLPVRSQGRVAVEPTLEVPGLRDVYVIGDGALVAVPEGAVPMLAPPAMQMGDHVARNVMRRLAGLPSEPFRYRDPGTMATIGRKAAVVKLGWIELTGFPAWIFWLFVHLMKLVGFRNRIVVLVDWAWQYIFFRPASPLIVDEPFDRREGK